MSGEMRGLPEGWTKAAFGEVINSMTNGMGGVQSKTGIGIPVSRIETIAQGFVDFERIGFIADYDGEKSHRHRLCSGDILFSHINSPSHLGKTAIFKNSEALYHGINLLRILVNRDVLSPEYFQRYCVQLRLLGEFALHAQHAVNQSSLNQTKLSAFQIPLAPLAEQKVIAEKLDALLTKVDTLKARLDAIPLILKRFRQSVLTSAVTGKLTEEWRSSARLAEQGIDCVRADAVAKAEMLAKNESLSKRKSSANSGLDEEYSFSLPELWSMSTWGVISEWISYGFTRPMPSSEDGVKLVTAKDVHRFDLRLEKSGYTTLDAFENLSEKDVPRFGDLLITKDGSIGRAALVKVNEKFCINQSVAVCWLRSTKMDKAFLEMVANAEYTQKFVQDKAKGMAIQHLSITDFAQCPVPVPPRPEQTEIVRRVESLFAFADQIEARAQEATSRVKHLTQSILAKAFRGELTEEWRKTHPDLVSGQNSAEALLERIRTARAAAPESKGKRGRVASPESDATMLMAAESEMVKRRGSPRKG